MHFTSMPQFGNMKSWARAILRGPRYQSRNATDCSGDFFHACDVCSAKRASIPTNFVTVLGGQAPAKK